MKLGTVSDQPVVVSDRLTMRPLRRSDAGLLSLFSSDRRVASATRSIPHPLPPGATEAYIARAGHAERTEDCWALDGTQSDLPELLGVITFERMDRNQSEVKYWVAPAFWNTGLASEAVNAMVAANPQGAKVLFGSVFQDNPASARVLTNAGFTYLGDAEAYSVGRAAKVATWTYTLKLG